MTGKPRLSSTVLARLAEGEAGSRDFLEALCAAPSVSRSKAETLPPAAPPLGEAELRTAAYLLVDALRSAGLAAARLVEQEGGAPYVVAEWLGAADKPTLLLYGHYDVQPSGRAESWTSPAFTATERGGRLYARGAADDKGGCAAIVAALRAWLQAEGRLPINVRVLVEGEEEIGSPHFAAFLAAHPKELEADFVLLCDGGNLKAGQPSVAYTARGALSFRITVEALRAPLHSGLFGGALPDPATTLCAILGRLVDDRGRIAVPGLYDSVRQASAAEREAIKELDDSRLRADAGLLPGADFFGEEGYGFIERLWLRPALVTCALDGRPFPEMVAAYMEKARAVLLMRTVADMDADVVAASVTAFLKSLEPRGCLVTVESPLRAPWWRTEPDHPLIRACQDALAEGYGRPALRIGEGGTIGVLGPLAAKGRPCALLGVEDAACAAHGADESVDLADFHAFSRSLAALFAFLA